MATRCSKPIKGRVMRLVRLDACGVPVTGAGSVVTTRGFVRIAPAPEYEEGDETIVKNANGDLCVNEKDADQLKRVGLTIDFCEVDPDALVIITGDRLLSDGATGTGVAFGEGAITARFSLEVWQNQAGADACAGGTQRYIYWAFANIGNAKVGDFEIAAGTVTFTIEAETKPASSSWGDGPGTGTSWLPGALETTEHFAFNNTATAPPTPPETCGATALT